MEDLDLDCAQRDVGRWSSAPWPRSDFRLLVDTRLEEIRWVFRFNRGDVTASIDMTTIVVGASRC